VKLLESTEESKRRPFTLSEIKRILKACNDEWRGLVLFGLYIGQRLGELARLTWRAVNLETNEIAFTAKKTGRRWCNRSLIISRRFRRATIPTLTFSRMRPNTSAPHHCRISFTTFALKLVWSTEAITTPPPPKAAHPNANHPRFRFTHCGIQL
jgi:integrase